VQPFRSVKVEMWIPTSVSLGIWQPLNASIRAGLQASESGSQAVLVHVKKAGLLPWLLADTPGQWHCLVSRALPVAILLVCANDELAQELVAETVEVITVELGRLLTLEVGFCDFC